MILNPLYKKIKQIYEKFDIHIRSYYMNIKYELEMFVEYAVLDLKETNISKIMTKSTFNKYIDFLKNRNINSNRAMKIVPNYIK